MITFKRFLESEQLKESVQRLFERWDPDLENKPKNEFGEKWKMLSGRSNVCKAVEKVLKDCGAEHEIGVNRMYLISVHQIEPNGHYIACFGGGANGGRDDDGWIKYFNIVKKVTKGLVDEFGDVWMLDFDNDCADDVWTLRLCFPSEKPKKEDKKKALKAEALFGVLESQLLVEAKNNSGKKTDKEIEEENKPCWKTPDAWKSDKYLNEFREELGYKDDYYPEGPLKDIMNSLASEVCLEMPTDTAARECEGDAVMWLIKSGRRDAIKAAHKLGDMIMANKGGKEIIKAMREAWLQLLHCPDEEEKYTEDGWKAAWKEAKNVGADVPDADPGEEDAV